MKSNTSTRKKNEYTDTVTPNGEVNHSVIHTPDNVLAAIAPHGGNIERETDMQAHACAEAAQACSRWVFSASPSDENAFEHHHTPSTEIDPYDYSTLAVLAEADMEKVVSFHGWNPNGTAPDIYIGGLLSHDKRRSLARQLRSETPRRYDVAVAEPGDDFSGYRGRAQTNLVNQLCSRGGLQLEQSMRARKEWGQQIATVVGEFLSEDS